MTKGGKLNEGIFAGATINTPSLLCVEDALDGAALGRGDRRAAGADRRAEANLAAVAAWVAARDWVDFLAADAGHPLLHQHLPEDRRPLVPRARPTPSGAAAKAVAGAGRASGAGYDIGAYRDAPPGLRIWGGATVERGRHRGPAALAGLGLRPGQGRPPPPHEVSSMPKVLISDKMSPLAAELLRARGLEVDEAPGLAPDALAGRLGVATA